MSVISDATDGCLFEYVHQGDEPDETLEMARRVALSVADIETHRKGSAHVVARFVTGRGFAVYPEGHAQLASNELVPVYELTADGTCRRLIH